MRVNKIMQNIYKSGTTKIIKKVFQRGLQTIECKSAYNNNKLYFRSWKIDEHNRTRTLSQAYSDSKPIKKSRSIIDWFKNK